MEWMVCEKSNIASLCIFELIFEKKKSFDPISNEVVPFHVAYEINFFRTSIEVVFKVVISKAIFYTLVFWTE